MIIPVRCFTCNKIIGDKYSTYLSKIQEEEKKNPQNENNRTIDTNLIKEGNITKSIQGKILDELKIKRYCCRRMFLTQVDIVDII
jgi:DNA-directed RNA polymerase I, II, and III subunit RPABC5|tara:strand:- start:10 stop:264 length:255 start_codon:yes stop_codon:yes gene_type:complete